MSGSRTGTDHAVLIHIDAQGFLEVKQGPDALVLFIDERTMDGTVLVVPKADDMPDILSRIKSRPMVSDVGADPRLEKPLMALRRGLIHVSERTS